MILFLIAIFAGVLTILAPCVLPLLPVIIGSSDGSKKWISGRALRIISALALSVILFTLLLKASTLLIDIPQSFWAWFSGSIIILLGIVTIFPTLWSKIPGVNKLQVGSNKALGTGYSKKTVWGDVIVGLSLGPVFTTCSPTYFFILATVLPASLELGILYLIGFTIGMSVSLLIVAVVGQRLVASLTNHQKGLDIAKKVFGVLFILVGIAIITGFDKQLSTMILDAGGTGLVNFEEGLVDQFQTK